MRPNLTHFDKRQREEGGAQQPQTGAPLKQSRSSPETKSPRGCGCWRADSPACSRPSACSSRSRRLLHFDGLRVRAANFSGTRPDKKKGPKTPEGKFGQGQLLFPHPRTPGGRAGWGGGARFINYANTQPSIMLCLPEDSGESPDFGQSKQNAHNGDGGSARCCRR